MRKRIFVTDNEFLILGLIYYYPSFFSFISYDVFFNRTDAVCSDATYVFDLSFSNFEMINIVKKIEKDSSKLNDACMIFWGLSTNVIDVSYFKGFCFFDTKLINNRYGFFRKIRYSEKTLKYSLPSNSLISNRELLVLDQLIKGRKVTSIAINLNRSIKTISAQKRNIMLRFGLKNELSFFIFMKSFFAHTLSRVR